MCLCSCSPGALCEGRGEGAVCEQGQLWGYVCVQTWCPFPPHSHMPTPPTGGQVSSSATAESSVNRGRGGGRATTEQDVRLKDEYQGPHEGVHVHTHTNSVDPKGCQFLTLEMCVERLSTLLSAVCIAVHVRVYVCVLFGGTLRSAPNKGRPVTPSPGEDGRRD